MGACRTKFKNNIRPTIPVVARINKIDESDPLQECESIFKSFKYNCLAVHILLNPIPTIGDSLKICQVSW